MRRNSKKVTVKKKNFLDHFKRRGKRSKIRHVHEQISEWSRPGKLRTDFPWVLITSSFESMLKTW